MPVTTTTQIGRDKLELPDLGYEGGSALHGLVATMFTRLSDNGAMRYTGDITLADSVFEDVVHNFGQSYAELYVQIFESDALISEEDKAKNYLIQTVDANTVRITNISGGGKTFYAYVWAMNFERLLGEKSYFYQTTDATPVTIASFATKADKTAFFEFIVVARINGTTSNCYTFKALAENNSGTAIATLISSEVYEKEPLLDAYVDGLGSAIRIVATGKSATTIDWHVKLKTSYLF